MTDPTTLEARAELRRLCKKVRPGWTVPIEAPALLALLNDNDDLRDKLAEVEKALENLLRATPAFRLKPIGASYSVERMKQEDHIAAEDAARKALARIRSGGKTEGG